MGERGRWLEGGRVAELEMEFVGVAGFGDSKYGYWKKLRQFLKIFVVGDLKTKIK